MRKIALAMVLAATSVHAAEELKFGDLNYNLKTGEQNVRADLSSVYSKFTSGDTFETRGYVLDTRYGYGINDQLTAYAGFEYAYDLETEIDDGNDATELQDFSSDGLSNPMIGADYRFMSQNSDMFNVDFGAVLKMNILDSETGYGTIGDSEDGNYTGITEPRSSLELNARVGNKWNEANEWQLAGGLIYFKDGETEELDDNSDTEIDSSMDLFLRAAYQYRPVNEFMMLVSLQGTRVGEVDKEVSGIDATFDSHIDFDFRFTAKYLITDGFIAKFNYGQGFNADYDVEDSEVDERRENFFGLGVEFLF